MARKSIRVAALCGVVFMGACQQPTPPAALESPPYDLGFDMKMLMSHVIDAAADEVWSSAGEVVTAAGVEDLAPTNEDEWHHVEAAGATLVESGNLLLMPGRDPGKDDWKQFAKALSAMGHKVMNAAEAKDKDALFQAGADLYSVCVACHQAYAMNLPVKVDLEQSAETE